MKKLILLSVFVSLLLTNCGRKKHSDKKTNEERIEITPFYRNKVFVKDLHLIDTNMFLVEKEEFLNEQQLKVLTDAMWAIIRNPTARVFVSSPDFNKPATVTQLRERFVRCDSVIEMDTLGNAISKPYFACDSSTIMNGVSMIYFFESWYLNTKTNLIEKETLGYSVFSYVPFKEAFKEVFLVFRDQQAIDKAKKYYFAD